MSISHILKLIKSKKPTVKIRCGYRNSTQLQHGDYLRISTKTLYWAESQAI